ncbi:MAG: hypothetical protein WCX31_19440 [Salinivirgaceae bacterium]|jgi:hypothetical protein
MSKTIKILLTLFVAGVVIGIGVYRYTFYKPHRNLTGEKPVAKLEATALMAAFEANDSLANATYLDKAVEVTGIIGEVTPNGNTFTINLKVEGVDFGGIKCTLEDAEAPKTNGLKPGQTISFKGQCTGWINDVDLGMKEVSLTRCVLVE